MAVLLHSFDALHRHQFLSHQHTLQRFHDTSLPSKSNPVRSHIDGATDGRPAKRVRFSFPASTQPTSRGAETQTTVDQHRRLAAPAASGNLGKSLSFQAASSKLVTEQSAVSSTSSCATCIHAITNIASIMASIPPESRLREGPGHTATPTCINEPPLKEEEEQASRSMFIKQGSEISRSKRRDPDPAEFLELYQSARARCTEKPPSTLEETRKLTSPMPSCEVLPATVSSHLKHEPAAEPWRIMNPQDDSEKCEGEKFVIINDTSGLPKHKSGAASEALLKPFRETDSGKGRKLRRPYRFCSMCWAHRSEWVLRSVTLPGGLSTTLNGHTYDMCLRTSRDATISPDQNRAYATAFKSAQRKLQLHEIALKVFESLMPGSSREDIHLYLLS